MRDVIAVCQRLRCLRSGNRAERRAFDHFAGACSAAEPEEFNVILKESSSLTYARFPVQLPFGFGSYE